MRDLSRGRKFCGWKMSSSNIGSTIERERWKLLSYIRVHTGARNREQSPHSGSTNVELTVKTTCYLAVTCRTMITGDDNDELIERGDYSRSNTGKTHVYYRKSYIPGLAGLEWFIIPRLRRDEDDYRLIIIKFHLFPQSSFNISFHNIQTTTCHRLII